MDTVILCGIEAQACVQQTVIDLLEKGYNVHVIADAVSSRSMVDRYVLCLFYISLFSFLIFFFSEVQHRITLLSQDVCNRKNERRRSICDNQREYDVIPVSGRLPP